VVRVCISELVLFPPLCTSSPPARLASMRSDPQLTQMVDVDLCEVGPSRDHEHGINQFVYHCAHRMRRFGLSFVIFFLLASQGFSESGAEAWLRYAPLKPAIAARYSHLPATVVILDDSALLKSARTELLRGMRRMLGRTLGVTTSFPEKEAIVLGTVEAIRNMEPSFLADAHLQGDGYALLSARIHGENALVITAATDRGVLYGTFALLRKIAQGESIAALHETEIPSAPLRWVNQWDNLDGSIELGYAGASVFFDGRRVRSDLTRAPAYARLLASIGINGCTVNNVNANAHILDPDFIPELARIADVFRPYGVQLSAAVNVSMPKQLGTLDTFDPLEPKEARWWQSKLDEVYRQIPDFGAVVVKADSEGQLGPSIDGRTPADAANVIARALKPHGGIVFYRAFVYNHHLDWKDPKADRARAAYDTFHPLDGKFDDNVIIQIKHGPIDFQVREPVSPLFGGLEQTNEAIELQITQEYTGQQRHTVFLVPMWKEVLDFDLAVSGQNTPVKDIVAGRSFHRPLSGYVGVANVGLSTNWLANHLALANLYGFGRLAWNPDLSSQSIAEEWTKLTFGSDPELRKSCLRPGRLMKTTLASLVCRRLRTSPGRIMVQLRSRRSAMDGASGFALNMRALEWTAPFPPEPDLWDSTRRPFRRFTNPLPIHPTTLSCSSIMCLTRTSCTRARRSFRQSMIPTMKVRIELRALLPLGHR
jgi:alpha-glucuronidase